MKLTTRLSALLLAALMVLCVLTACTPGGEADTIAPATESPTEGATNPVTEAPTDSVTDPATEPATEPVTDPPAEPAAQILFDADTITRYFSGANQCKVSAVEDPEAGKVIRLETSGTTFNDPFIFFSVKNYFKAIKRDMLKAEDCPVLLIKIRCINCSNGNFNLFYCAGATASPIGQYNTTSSFDNGDTAWQYVMFDLSKMNGWTGNINGFRLDFMVSATEAGEMMDIAGLYFAKSVDEAYTIMGYKTEEDEVIPDDIKQQIDALLAIKDNAAAIPNTALTAEKEDSGLNLWFDHTYTKTPAESVISTGRNSYQLRLARNEIEACQFLLATADGRKGLTASVTDFRNEAGDTLTADLLYGYYFADVDGKTIADPLPPLTGSFDLPAGQSRLFVVKAHSKADSKPGAYVATLTVRDADGNEIKKANIYAWVWNFVLPEETSCKTQTDLSWYNIYVAHKCWNGDDSLLYKNYYDYLLENRLCAYTLPYSTNGTFSDSRIDQYLNNPRVVAFNPLGWKTDANAGNVASAYEYLSKHPEWLKKAYFYLVDEPTSKEMLDRIVDSGKLLTQYFPGYKQLSPMHVNYSLNGSSTEDYFSYVKDYVNVWVPHTYFWNTFAQYRKNPSLTFWMTAKLEKNFGVFGDRMKAEQAGGDEVWWYVTRRPENPEITLTMETQAVRYRTMFWQQKLYGVDGFLYYLSNDWYEISENAGLNAKHETADDYDVYGNGVLLYSGAPFDIYGPVGSLRLECVRDGIEDFEYLTMLSDLYGEETANYIIKRLTTSLGVYNTDEEFFTALRIAVGNLIEAKQAK